MILDSCDLCIQLAPAIVLYHHFHCEVSLSTADGLIAVCISAFHLN